MSIDATVWEVTRDSEGPVLWLTGREPDGIAGQGSLRVIGSCSSAERLVGSDIWAGGGGPIMLGEVEIGQRIGYSRCTLTNHGIEEALANRADPPS